MLSTNEIALHCSKWAMIVQLIKELAVNPLLDPVCGLNCDFHFGFDELCDIYSRGTCLKRWNGYEHQLKYCQCWIWLQHVECQIESKWLGIQFQWHIII